MTYILYSLMVVIPYLLIALVAVAAVLLIRAIIKSRNNETKNEATE